jgi:hypothetical protein
MNDETGTMTIKIPPNQPWQHIVIEEVEEINLDVPFENSMAATTDPKLAEGKQGDGAAAPN